MSDSDAALQVLTDPVLFREVIAWTTGWPGLVAAKLFQRPNGRRWHFDSTATVTDALFRVADVKTLEVARSARWWNAAGELVGFELADVTQALRSGNAAAVQFVFATTDVRTGTYDMFYAYWSLGVSHCRGHHDVLDVLQEFVPPQQGLFKFVFSADYMFSIRHASVARWFVEHYGPGCLPTELILTALQRGCLGLFYYLRKIGGQAPSKLYELPDPVDKKRVKAIVQCDTNNTKRSRDRLLRLVARSDDIELIDQVLSDWSLQASASAVREATATLQQLADEGQMHLVRPRIEHLPTKTLEDNIPPRSCVIS